MYCFIWRVYRLHLQLILIMVKVGASNPWVSMSQHCGKTGGTSLGSPYDTTTRMITGDDPISFMSSHRQSSVLVTLPKTMAYSTDTDGYKPRSLHKRGIAYNDARIANSFHAYCPYCHRAYNWASSSEGLSKDLRFVPMLWSGSNDHTQPWPSNMAKAILEGCQEILSFNEPDLTEQANMKPEEAALKHVQYLNPFTGRVKIGAPSVSNSMEENEGLQWLSAFFTACAQQEQKCEIDFCPVHWYSRDAQYAGEWRGDLLNYLRDAHEVCGRRSIWLTEFSVPGPDHVIESFLEDVMPQLEELDYLGAYFYFMVTIGRLMATENSLSPYGRIYATFP